jgi:predicted DNA-binding transcriptional regulator YafY
MARTRRITVAERHAKEAGRRRKVAARRVFAELGVKGRVARFAYHSAGKDEITVREVKVDTAELRISKKGAPYIRAFDFLRGEYRTFTTSRIGWAVAA